MSNKRRVVHSQGREIVHNVYKFMKTEREEGRFVGAGRIVGLVSQATGVGQTTVQKICKEGAANPEGYKFTSPRKNVNQPKPKSTVDACDEEVLRKIIYNFSTMYHRRPTMAAVFEKVQEDLPNFQGKISSFRKVVYKLGFRWKKTQDNRKLLVETLKIRSKRIEFLRKLKAYKNEGRNIVYTDETYLHSSHTVPKAWDDGTKNCLKAPVSKGQRLIIVHAGGAAGFVPNGLLIFKSGLKTGDYHDDMNHKNYVKWLKEKLIPNLAPNSVLVIDNASYHNVTVEPNPTSAWLKANMQKWLNERNIHFDIKSTKPELYTKIQLHKPTRKIYVIDTILAEHGHSVLRLPPYHPELNPIEKIWALVKNHVAAYNTTFKLDDVWKLAKDKCEDIGQQEWQNICSHVEKTENEYMENEYVIDNVQELVIRIGEESEESDFGFTDSGTEDSEDEDLGCQPLL